MLLLLEHMCCYSSLCSYYVIPVVLNMFIVITFMHMYLCFILRALMTHASVSQGEREKLGISDTLVCSYINGKLDLVAVCT